MHDRCVTCTAEISHQATSYLSSSLWVGCTQVWITYVCFGCRMTVFTPCQHLYAACRRNCTRPSNTLSARCLSGVPLYWLCLRTTVTRIVHPLCYIARRRSGSHSNTHARSHSIGSSRQICIYTYIAPEDKEAGQSRRTALPL